MLRSMFSGITGLESFQTFMDTVGNNIANVNTVGFKGSRVNFQDLLYQTMSGGGAPAASGSMGGTNPVQVGLGTEVASIQKMMGSGAVEQTGNGTDLAIQGNGFFVVSGDGAQKFTRAGDFIQDAAGNLVDPSGNYVQGWVASGGALPTESANNMGNIRIPLDASATATSTANVALSGNIASDPSTTLTSALTTTGATSLPVGAGAPAVWAGEQVLISDGTNSETVTIANATAAGASSWTLSGTGTTKTHTAGASIITGAMTQANVYDSLGNTVPVYITLVPTTTADSWTWSASTVPPGGAGTNQLSTSTSTSGTVGIVGKTTGTVVFNANGTVSSGSPLDLVLGNSATLGDGAAGLQGILVDLSSLTQSAGATTMQPSSVDGGTAGTLSGFAIDPTGTITGSFTNGTKQTLGQIAMANFANPGGLIAVGGADFEMSPNANLHGFIVGQAGTQGFGSLIPGALEQSNVDLSQEFTNMITAERAFQANAQVISTSDQILQTLTQMR